MAMMCVLPSKTGTSSLGISSGGIEPSASHMMRRAPAAASIPTRMQQLDQEERYDEIDAGGNRARTTNFQDSFLPIAHS